MTPNLCRLQLCSNAMESDKKSCGFWKQGAAGAVVWLLDTARYMQYSMYCIATVVCPMPKKSNILIYYVVLIFISSTQKWVTPSVRVHVCVGECVHTKVYNQPDKYFIRCWVSLLNGTLWSCLNRLGNGKTVSYQQLHLK